MKLAYVPATVALTLAALAGCTTMGMGSGELTVNGKSAEPVVFSWKSTDGGLSGTMVATLPDATYTGQFFEVTKQTQGEMLAPMWTGWNEGWYDWPYWRGPWPGPYGATEFITHYSGKVVANLQGDDGQRMRCRFSLAHPAAGMSDGGDGECQLAGGRVIDAVISPS